MVSLQCECCQVAAVGRLATLLQRNNVLCGNGCEHRVIYERRCGRFGVVASVDETTFRDPVSVPRHDLRHMLPAGLLALATRSFS
jgi:hypothetical protein